MDSSWSAFQRFSAQIQGDFLKKTRKKKKERKKLEVKKYRLLLHVFKEAFSVAALNILQFKSSKLCKLT